MSENPTIQQSLALVMEDVQAVAKKDRNNSQGFNFRGIDAVVNAVAPALRKHKVVVVPAVLEHQYGTVEIGKNRTPMSHVILKVSYRFIGIAGDAIEAVVVSEAMDSGDKAMSKAMSVAFRTALLQALALPTDEPDPDSVSYERSVALPPATVEEYNAIHSALLEADSAESLTQIAQTVGNHNFTDEDKKSLRTVYTQRFAELTS
jgi:hypothetical protein